MSDLKPHYDLDRSAAFSILLDVMPGFAESPQDDGATITGFLAAWYTDPGLDMHAFAVQWVQEVCSCGHHKSQHSVVEMGGSTRGIECCVNPETGEPECGCMAPEYDLAHEVAEALEARLPEGMVIGEEERSVIRDVLA